ncbi:anhydro-N-acetylmuramic acid kinase [uncultured Albimonas sp.]|uniref:anhydro-N-acetylmuramic acid kinase n=1 Tax=uncultured Albimonas sp. TaxID=1331701 RepID=UPI0030EBD05D
MDAIWALGLMSGTSFDGIDAALVKTDGVGLEAFGPGGAFDYAPGEMDAARAVHADWRPFRRAAAGGDAAATLAQAGREVDAAHAAASARLLARAEAAEALPEIVGYHGQTVAHGPDDPAGGWTWQLGDGAALARALNRTVAWDFRCADVTAGGQGAPLAPFYHFALARALGRGPVCFLNLGGVGNVSWADPEAAGPEAPGALVGFDTGPANALVDDWMRARTGQSCDRDGAAAAAGRVHVDRLRRNSIEAFVARRPPKSLDRNEFVQALEAMQGLSTEDGAATLTALSAICAAGAQAHLPRPAATWILCGGGRLNPTLAAMIAERVEAEVIPAEAAGLDGDLLEAQCFAYLAVRALRGLPLSAPGTTGVPRPLTGGRISRP